MTPGAGKTYADVTQPLRSLTVKSVSLEWTKAFDNTFNELKQLLITNHVMAYFDPIEETMLYVDEGSAGVAAIMALKFPIRLVKWAN